MKKFFPTIYIFILILYLYLGRYITVTVTLLVLFLYYQRFEPQKVPSKVRIFLGKSSAKSSKSSAKSSKSSARFSRNVTFLELFHSRINMEIIIHKINH